MEQKKSVVVFCGGRGALSVIRSLIKEGNYDITAIINGYDDGKSTGVIRRMYNMLGPSDIRKIQLEYYRNSEFLNNDLLRLMELRASNKDELIKYLEEPEKFLDLFIIEKNTRLYIIDKLMNFRKQMRIYENIENYSDFSIGNCIYAATYKSLSDNIERTILEISNLLHIRHSVLTISNESLYLCALDNSGQIYSSEYEIDTSKCANFKKIYTIADYREINNKMLLNGSLDRKCKILDSLNRVAKLSESAVQKILSANIIIYAPGTRSTSFLPIFFNKETFKFISENNSALKLFISNLNSEYKYHYCNPLEEINSFFEYSFIHDINKIINYCFIDNSFLGFKEKIEKYKFVAIFDNLTKNGLYHDGDKIVKILKSL